MMKAVRHSSEGWNLLALWAQEETGFRLSPE